MDNGIYGHAGALTHYGWFDTAVNAWLVEQGLLDIERGPVIGLVVETGCTYLQPIAFPMELQAGIAVAWIRTTSVCYEVGLFLHGGGEPAAQGFFVHCYVDRESRRPCPLDAQWRERLAQIATMPEAPPTPVH
jgi:acyl-CoA thioester hydrolase